MKRLLFVVLVLAAPVVLAGPVRPIRSDMFNNPAQPCGPAHDPFAIQGQWFFDPINPDPATSKQVRAWEFHDDDEPLSIRGIVQSITYDGPPSNIVAFTVLATVFNNLPSIMPPSASSNSHSEVQSPPYPGYTGPMLGTRITAEFAVAEMMKLPSGTPPYYTDPVSGGRYFIEAVNEHERAWYCWTPENPQGLTPGDYQVPAWILGDIPPGSSKQVLMQFQISGGVMPRSDYRHSVIRYSKEYQADLLYNRHNSLKISHWLDTLLIDYGGIITAPPGQYEEPPPEYIYASDASVFFDAAMDFGDAPDSPYPTLLANNGARHLINTNIHLGKLIDGEPDGQPDPNATGDDINKLADEDGVSFTSPLNPGQIASVNVECSTAGFLSAWIDFNGNGFWADPGEQIFAVLAVGPGINPLTFAVPPAAILGRTFARFRFTTKQTALSFVGLAEDGEVEDYEVFIREKEYDFGDAPEGVLAYPATGLPGQFPTCKSVGPPASWIQHGLGWARFGQGWDAEPEGNAGNPLFTAYDQDECFGDGDAGLLFPGVFTITGAPGSQTVVPCPASPGGSIGAPCQTAVWGTHVDIHVINNMPVFGYVNVLMDWNQNGQWGPPVPGCPGGAIPEHVLINFPVPAGYNGPLSNLMPPAFQIGPRGGYLWSRFSITEQPVQMLPWDGSGIFEDGETEDYLLHVQELDFGDALDGINPPGYPTLLLHDGARHIVVTNVHLGRLIDTETDGQPDNNATGDDLSHLADEDGVIIPSPLLAGALTSIRVTASVPGYLNAWIDWNANSTWEPHEQVYLNTPLAAGTNDLALAVPGPPVMVAGGPHSRWRFTTYAPAAPLPTGMETDGEVEDYEVKLEVLDFGDAPAPYPTQFADDGARHMIPSLYYLGTAAPDYEPEGQPDPDALGDDSNGTADEDGVSLAAPLIRGSNTTFNVVASTKGSLNAWIDFNQNGSWGDSGEQIANDAALMSGTNVLSLTVPSLAAIGPTFGRFRFSSYKGLLPTGVAYDGEVEDYAFTIYQPQPSVNIAITNITCDATTGTVKIEWNGATPIIYEAQYTDLLTSNMTWTAWGGYVDAAPYEQSDSFPSLTSRFYRVTAPYTAP